METGWKMLGETSPPQISFNKDSKLLITVDEPSKVEIIDAVLGALEPLMPSAAWLCPLDHLPLAVTLHRATLHEDQLHIPG
jgi:hypothetical protein